MELFAGRLGGLFGANQNSDVYKQLPMSGALWNHPNNNAPRYNAYPVAYANQQMLVTTTGQDSYVGSVYNDVLDQPPPTVLARFFYNAMQWVYNVNPNQRPNQPQKGEKQPVYHLTKY